MSSQQAIWTSARNLSGEIFKLTRAAVNPIIKELELDNGPYFFALFAAKALEPKSLYAEYFCIRAPYSHPSRWETPLGQLVERGMLAAHGDGQYTLTQTGRDAIVRILDAFYQQLNVINHSALASNEVDQTAHDLKRVIDACLAVSEFAVPGLNDSHRVVPPGDATSLAHIDQAIDDLSAFRDDAHMASFKPHAISGHAWELFTFLWHEQVKNADEMTEKVTTRGYTRKDYMEALDELVRRGWVEQVQDDTYKLTAAGRHIREESEVKTDHFFYSPWANTFSAEQAAQLHDRLTGIETSLKRMAEAELQ